MQTRSLSQGQVATPCLSGSGCPYAVSATETLLLHFMQERSKLPANRHRRRFAKSARHHAPRGLESRLQLENQADTTESQTAEEPNEDSDAESSSLPASPPVVSNIAGYNLAQDKIIYVWDVQRLRRGRAINAEKERKKRLAIEAALVRQQQFEDLLNSLVC